MKKGITLAVSLLLSAFLGWGSTPPEPSHYYCPEFITDDTLPLSDQIEHDLVAGVWLVEQGSESETLLEFDSEGQATILESNGDFTYKLTRYSWEIEAANEHPVLLLRNQANQETQYFLINPTGNGMQLTQLSTGKAVTYVFHSSNSEQTAAVKAALTGEWRNTRALLTLRSADCDPGDALELEEASISFEFQSDGAFTKVVSSDVKSIRFEERGRWEVSKDGDHLLLHTPSADGTALTQRIRIKFLELDELVLETPLAVVGRTFASVPNKDFYFNKL